MTSRPLSLVSLLRIAPGLLLLLAAGCSTPDTASHPAPPATSSTPAPAKAEGAFDDDAHALTPIETMVTVAGKDPAKQAAVERDLLATMQKPDAAPALVQEAAQHLGYVMQTGPSGPAPTTLAVLAPMLADPAKVDYARLALDRVPGASVDALYLKALPAATGRTRLALIGSAGTRGLAAAAPLLAPWLNDADPALATATAQALGRIGGAAALTALESAKQPLAPAVLNARLAAVTNYRPGGIGDKTRTRIPREIYRNTAALLPQRSAALRQLIETDQAGAIDEIHAALTGPERTFQQVAIESVSSLRVADAGAKLAERLAAYPADVQVALIAALGHRADAGAVPGLLKALDSTETDVRLAAIEALGRQPGSAEVVQRLARLIADKGAEAKAASASLARLNGPGLDDLVRAGAATNRDTALQAVFVQQLGARNQTESIPFLLGLQPAPVEAVRLEALDALRLMATSSDQAALIAWAVGTESGNEQSRAVRALVTIALRDGDLDLRAKPVVHAIDIGETRTRLILLPALSRLGGPLAQACAARHAAGEANEAVALAAITELARWPDASVLPQLVDLSAGTPLAAVRTTGVKGATRFLARNSGQPAAQRSASVRKLLGLPIDLPEKLALLNVLSLCSDQPALAAARGFLADPATAETARDAVDIISSNLAGPPTCTASASPANLPLLSDGQANTHWTAPNAPGSWLLADLHNSRPVRKLVLDQGTRERDFPAGLEIQVSDDPAKPGEVRATAEGTRGETVVTLPAGIRGRYVWIRVTGTRSGSWAIAELTVE